MAQIVASLRVVTPWWMPVAVFAAKQWFGWRAFFLGRELTDDELAAFVEWWGRHIKVVPT